MGGWERVGKTAWSQSYLKKNCADYMLPAGHQPDSSKPWDLPLRSQAQVAKNT